MMGFANIGVPSLILILVVCLVIFGPGKLPGVGKAVGQSIKEFKNEMNDTKKDEDESETKVEASTADADKKSEYSH